MIDKMRSPWFVAIGLILLLLTTVKHNVFVFEYLTMGKDNLGTPGHWYTYFQMVAFEFAILLFTVNGKQRLSAFFAVVIGLFIFSYYGIQMGLPSSLGDWLAYIPGTIHSLSVGIMVHSFSTIFVGEVQHQDNANELARLQADISRLENAILLDITENAQPASIKKNIQRWKSRVDNNGISADKRDALEVKIEFAERALNLQ